jgi:hypothetical protein
MKTVTVHSKKHGRTFELGELTAAQASLAFGLGAGTARTIHYGAAMAIRKMDGVVQFQLHDEPTVRLLIQGIPESLIDALAKKYSETFDLNKDDTTQVPEYTESGGVKVTSKRHGHTYEFKELNGLQSADAFGMAAGLGNINYARYATAIEFIDGMRVPPAPNNGALMLLLEKIPKVDIELVGFFYDKEYELKPGEMGNESPLEDLREV